MTAPLRGPGRCPDGSPGAGHSADDDDSEGPAGIHRVAPPGCSAAGTTTPGTAADLVGPEHDGTASMVPVRLAEYAAARRCGHRALDGLGIRPVGIPRDGRGAPVWPHGVVGSLTHCVGYAAAIVADARDFAALGIDAEPHEPLPAKVLERISGPAEVDGLAALAAVSAGIAWDRIQFCAKEAIFKTLSPQDQRSFRPAEVRVHLDLAGALTVTTGAATAHGSPGADGETRRHGWWAVEQGRVLVCVVLEHDRQAPGPPGPRRAQTAAAHHPGDQHRRADQHCGADQQHGADGERPGAPVRLVEGRGRP